MDEYIYMKKSTLLIIIIIVILLFSASIYFIISYYEKKSTNIKVNIPTIVEDVNNIDDNNLNLTILED